MFFNKLVLFVVRNFHPLFTTHTFTLVDKFQFDACSSVKHEWGAPYSQWLFGAVHRTKLTIYTSIVIIPIVAFIDNNRWVLACVCLVDVIISLQFSCVMGSMDLKHFKLCKMFLLENGRQPINTIVVFTASEKKNGFTVQCLMHSIKGDRIALWYKIDKYTAIYSIKWIRDKHVC